MKPLFLITSFLLAGVVCGFTQNDTDENPFRKNEIGLNATSFVNSVVSLNDNDLPVGNYLLNYRRYIKPQFAWRMGMDARQGTSSNPNFFESSSADFGLRLGFQWIKDITPKWQLLSGIDILGTYEESEFVSRNTFSGTQVPVSRERTTTFKGFGYGIGPHIGVQYHINQRIGLFTESLLYFTTRSIERMELEEIIENGIVTSSQEDHSVQKDWRYNIALPTAIFFFVKF